MTLFKQLFSFLSFGLILTTLLTSAPIAAHAGGPLEDITIYKDSYEYQIVQYVDNVLKPHVKPLFDNQFNSTGQDTINIMFFTAKGGRSVSELLPDYRHALGTDGQLFAAVQPDPKDSYTYKTEDAGLLEIEPFRSNKSKFSFWYYDEPIDVSAEMPNLSWAFNHPYTRKVLGLQNVLKVFNYSYSANPGTGTMDGRSYATLAYTMTDYFTDKEQVVPGEISMLYDLYGSRNYSSNTLVHELGHALGGLLDEYSEDGRSSTYGPNCAYSQGEAEGKWGQYVGQVDPFFYEYRQAYADAYYIKKDGQYFSEFILDYDASGNPVMTQTPISLDDIMSPEDFRVGYIPGGCYGDLNSGFLKPTRNSLMSSATPILGSVDRAWVERMLSLLTMQPLQYPNIIIKDGPIPALEVQPQTELATSSSNKPVVISETKELPKAETKIVTPPGKFDTPKTSEGQVAGANEVAKTEPAAETKAAATSAKNEAKATTQNQDQTAINNASAKPLRDDKINPWPFFLITGLILIGLALATWFILFKRKKHQKEETVGESASPEQTQN